MRAKQIGTTIDRNPAKHTPKPRNSMPNIRKLIDSKRLVPIYQATEDTIFLIGYQRKARSRKASQRPFMLPQPLALGKIDQNPEPNPEPK
jgi:hypothetical protein